MRFKRNKLIFKESFKFSKWIKKYISRKRLIKISFFKLIDDRRKKNIESLDLTRKVRFT